MGHHEIGHPNNKLQNNSHWGTNTIKNVGNPEQKYQKPQLVASEDVDSPQKQEGSRNTDARTTAQQIPGSTKAKALHQETRPKVDIRRQWASGASDGSGGSSPRRIRPSTRRITYPMDPDPFSARPRPRRSLQRRH